MKYTLYIYIFLILLFSCGGGKGKSEKVEKNITEISETKGLNKLKSLLALSKDSVMEYFDLSHDSIKQFPDLSGYTIKKLNLSFNLLDTLVTKYLPQGIERLIISHNNLRKIFWTYKDYSSLKEIDVSFNHIERISIGEPLYRIIASHNALIYINFNNKHVHYLDISFNPKLNNKLVFDPSRIDTIIRKEIANDEPLYYHYQPRSGFSISCD